MEDTLSHVMAVWERQRSSSPIYSLLLESIEIYHAEHGIIHATLPVRALHVNSKGTLHGTLSACVVDWAAGMAIASTGHQVTGVSTDLSVSYLSTAKLGDTLEIQGKIGKIGKTLAFTTITIGKRVEEGIVNVVQGSHTKYIRQ
jgi:acyl-coenzyme A thioesterase 13